MSLSFRTKPAKLPDGSIVNITIIDVFSPHDPKELLPLVTLKLGLGEVVRIGRWVLKYKNSTLKIKDFSSRDDSFTLRGTVESTVMDFLKMPLSKRASGLRSKLIRLAYSNPNIRSQVLPLVKIASGWDTISKGDRGKYLDQVWDMYTKTYATIGLTVSNKQHLLSKYDFWKLSFDQGVPVAFSLMKTTSYGLKAGLSGSNMERNGKDAIKWWLRNRFKVHSNIYGEVSHKVEDISLAAGAPVLCSVHVPKVLGKAVKPSPDGIHYTRQIGPITAEKVLVGKPKGVPSHPIQEAGSYCPLVADYQQDKSLRLGQIEKDAADLEIDQAEHMACQFDWDE